ncbi:hypothetical protein QRN89_18450 [Streptomyces chengbuensis]|uniref:hypothetical protein n=1 Tax=Streptomyces TaxID=1883 RepID=UPI0025B4A09B|nr:hypothetical protein [Streptomyces sp. HUAS CB01]WJY51603.1 hypothetical protein QRN89_18450 [Streptomyces sp. HUAS CB01]
MNSSSTPPAPGSSDPLSPPAPHTGVLAWERRPGPERSGPRRNGPGELAQTPLYLQLVSEWRARGAMLPGARDPQWERLASLRAFEEDTQRTLRMLRLERDPLPPLTDAEALVSSGDGEHPAAPGAVAHLPRPR